MSLIEKYDVAVAGHDIVDDPLQRQVLCALEKLVQVLVNAKKTWFPWWPWRQEIRGCYIYGPVGIGKTFLMDLFFDEVSIPAKKRFHFHQFMQQIDARLRRLQGQKNPLKRIASELANSARLICFDEFMVEDVAHAMILAELLQELFHKGVVLVATSNSPPDELYRKGLHRKRFLPAIAAIQSHCEVLSLGDKRDYRLGRKPAVDTWICPLGDAAEARLEQQFDALAPESRAGTLLTIQNRDIVCVKCSEQAVWFEFAVICNLPRSQLDYLEIANRFDTVFVSNIPVLSEKDTVFAILLINFIDVMYDQGMHLVVSAAVPVGELYLQGELSPEFRRASSRLHEMQSVDYLARHPHRLLQNLETGS